MTSPLRSGRRAGMLALALACAFAGHPLTAAAQDYPSRPVQLIVPFAPGGAIDQMARAMGAALSRELGQPIVIENKPGAGGNIGAEQVARAAPTGYVLLVGTSATHGVNPSLYAKLPYDAVKDFVPVAHWGSVPNVLAVNAASSIRSVEDLVAQAKREPGKLTYGSAGNGTSLHLAGELFKQAAKVDLVHVPYRGGAPASLDLLAGNITMMFDTVAVSLPNLRAGKTRALAVAAPARHFALPDVPTFAEKGYPSVVSATWAGVFAPAGTPAAVVQKLEDANRRALEDPAVAEVMRKTGVQVEFRGSRDFATYVASEIALWGNIIRSNNIRAD
ncbi:tripartite tricarboxylate transporter substrate binding protein [Pigmentiphaga sp. GD03639]|uniref:Bug family tripartite tricarboxylate transporter substrate binding protein n=1 Tax=Pigmentiphaga sp. GD03639 TaxID=2975354 RepID=UPI00244A4E4F|nr:tripartite tricarboxylate transporter substrate binding protein [Pigmentiphaga sp. GD03639]MDH2234734.1 tripartite tricarboxylate transporter substrate binding protein [Pigmentiphaga sp. GD03639]